jgi:hypothetical protein
VPTFLQLAKVSAYKCPLVSVVGAECQENEDLVGNPPLCPMGRMYHEQNVNTGIGTWFLDFIHLIVLLTEDKSAQTRSVTELYGSQQWEIYGRVRGIY